MKKYGFTLAEVLITMGILGVLAALTVPSISSNVVSSQLTAALKTTSATISDKLDTAMAFEQVNDIRDLKAFGKSTKTDILKELDGYLSYYPVEGNHKIYGLNSGASSVMEWENAGIRQIHTKAFIYLDDFAEVRSTNTAAIRAVNGNLLRRNAIIYIDVNGFTKPNRLGYDVYKFYLGQDGRLYPVGGSDVSLFDSNGASETSMSWQGGDANYSCNRVATSDSAGTTAGYGCAGRVFDEGRIKYLGKK